MKKSVGSNNSIYRKQVLLNSLTLIMLIFNVVGWKISAQNETMSVNRFDQFLPANSPTVACTFNNGGLNPKALSDSGVAAPAGFFWSEVQHNVGNLAESNSIVGFGAQQQNNNRLADDFTIEQTCTLLNVVFYAYQTGAPASPSPFTGYTLRIHSGRPGDAGSIVVFGDTTTNRLVSSVDSSSFRVFNSAVPAPGTAPGTTRKIWANTVTINTTLAPGAYWLDWDSNAGALGSFHPSKTIAGSRGSAKDNARQFLGTSGAWFDVIDVGNPGTAPDAPQDLPFIINGAVSGPAPTTPVNNDFANAQIINGCAGSVNGTNLGANKEAGEPNHSPDGNVGGGSVWYQWQAPASGSVTLTTAGSNYDTLLGVYAGNSVNSLSPIVKNDDVGTSVRTSAVTFTATSGIVYRIAVDGWNNDRGTIARGNSVVDWMQIPCTPNTQPGSNVTVQAPGGDASLTFPQVTVAGNTTFTRINPPSAAGTPPAGYTILDAVPAYDITTTVTFTPPVTTCFAVSAITDPSVFARMRILHGESEQLVDRTILAPDTPAPNFSTRTVCARVNSLSPFVAALAPAASPTVTVSGRVTTPSGLGLRNAVVALTDPQGVRRTATTSSFGFYTFENVPAGQNYVVGVSSKRYRFAARGLQINDNMTNVDFVGLE